MVQVEAAEGQKENLITAAFSESYSEKLDGEIYRKKPIYDAIKRIVDIILSGIAIVILSWLFLIVSVIIITDSFGNPFYVQERVGRYGKSFKMIKFRSMYPGADKHFEVLTPDQANEYNKHYKVDNDPRITRVGKFLRKSSLDELPQLFNIFIGELSLIGPRPVLDEETRLYGTYRNDLLSVKPGLTGYWQAYARNNVSYDNGIRQSMELYYVKNRSALFDIRIFFQTFVTVFKKSGAK